MLRRALQTNSNEDRRNFFEDISACRRRPRRPLLEQPVARLFSSMDELKHLRQRALASRIKNTMWGKGLRVADAFQLFDFDGDGVLSPSELYGGLDGLGIKLLPAEVLSHARLDPHADCFSSPLLTPADMFARCCCLFAMSRH